MTFNSEWLFIAAAAIALLLLLVLVQMMRRLAFWRSLAHQREVEIAAAGSYLEQVTLLKSELEQEQAQRHEAEKNAEIIEKLATQKEAELAKRLSDFEQQREQSQQAARASILAVGQELSSKLLEDHKREQLQAKEAQEKLAQHTTKNLMEQFEKLTHSVSAIQTREAQTSKQVDAVMRALSNPAGAGQMSEIGLENSLKNLGLEAGRDFFMQYHIATDEGSNLRPDAVIFLPQDMVMVIDSKASQFALKLAKAEQHAASEEEIKAVLAELLASMHAHIKTLAQKQYGDEVAKLMKKRGQVMGRMLNVMYVPSESLIERLRVADPTLQQRCDKAGIGIASPASLAALFSLASQQISAARRDENQQEIIARLSEVLSHFATALGHADAVGKQLQGAAKKYGEFASSVNRFLLPKLRTMQALGVESAKNKALPHALKTYDVIDRDEILNIEADESDNDDSAAPLAIAKNG